jgi:two-component system sensor histidine kinase KdpD
VVAKDHSGDPATGLPTVSGGVPVGRQIAGVVVVIVGLPVVTVALVDDRDSLPLATPVLLVLLIVVVAAVLGGVRVGLPAALLGGLILNWFFTVPYGTLVVNKPEQLLVLGVYVTVAAAVSLVVGIAARRTAEATRAKAEAQALSSLAGAALAELETLPGLLEQIRTVFGVREVALLEHEHGTWSTVETVAGSALATPDEAELRVEVDPALALLVRGPALFGEDQRVLRSFARAAATALQGRRLAERAAEAAQFEAADRMRTALLAAVGHDLRTPLASIKAAVSSLRQHDIAWTAEETAELLKTIEDSADRLHHLVTNLLDASRLQAGVVSASIERVSLAELVDRALLTVTKPQRVEVHLPETLPDVLVDGGLAERVVANLLDNALQHSPPGSAVTVRGSRGADMVVCEIIDHGTGVPEHLWPQIFAPFQRLGDRQPGGIGLGLAVARGFTDAMGGRLEPTVTPGGGLTMQLLLPAASHLTADR